MKRCDKLGEGTFGIVYTAISPTTKKRYAVKRNLVEETTSFIGNPRELDLLAKLRNHPHIVRLEKVLFSNPFNEVLSPIMSNITASQGQKQRDDNAHFALEHADYDLCSFIYKTENMHFNLIKKYMVQILLAVEYMHSNNIIHRDLKPANILIFGKETDVECNLNVAKICDFGLSKPYTYQGNQTPGTVTSWYRPPEIVLGNPFYDYKSDIWSLGCILFEMIAKSAPIQVNKDDNDLILSAILKFLPVELPTRLFREYIRLNKWRKIKIDNYKCPERTSIKAKIGLTDEAIKLFNKSAGDYDLFCDLLSKMLEFHWEKRLSIRDCLNHPFFNDSKSLIDGTRKLFPPSPPFSYKYKIINCSERKWMVGLAINIFKRKSDIDWYKDRILFQAMDLFDRYLAAMSSITQKHENFVESDAVGHIDTKQDVILKFYVCIYLSIKYFSSICQPIPFVDIIPKEFINQMSLTVAENFEGGLIKNCLNCYIYRPTIYEAADLFELYLRNDDIYRLLVLYGMNQSINGLTPIQTFSYFYKNLLNCQADKIITAIVKID